MCQTMWRCPDCGGRMLAREQWAHQRGEETAEPATRNQHAGHVRWGHLGTDGIDRSEGGKATTSD